MATFTAGGVSWSVLDSGCVTGEPPEVPIEPGAEDLRIVQQPQDLTVYEETEAIFTILAEGTAPITYTWFWNGGAIPPTAIISNGGKTLRIPAAMLSDQGLFHVVVSNPLMSVTSRAARLTVVLQPAARYLIYSGYALPAHLTASEVAGLQYRIETSTRSVTVVLDVATVPDMFFFVAIEEPLGVGFNETANPGFLLGGVYAVMAAPEAPEPFGTGEMHGYSFESVTVDGRHFRLFRFFYRTGGALTVSIR